MKILAIESSCDETSAAVVENGTKIITNVVASSSEMHQKYGGIVPEIAARKQVESIIPVLTEALKTLSSDLNSIDKIAVTVGPGLIGSLLVGIETAKTLAMITGKPIIPVNHVIAHMYANFISKIKSQKSKIEDNVIARNDNDEAISPTHNSSFINHNSILFPAISLVVSGGHTEIFLMTAPDKIKWLGGTIDDAAGEAFDKGARILGFGSGGGLAIQNAAAKYKIQNTKYKINLPRPIIYDKTLNFSFSGLKTALMRETAKYPVIARSPKDDEAISLAQQLSHELQEAITDCLVKKTLLAAEKYQAKSILISGGVSSNLRLREKFSSKGQSAFGRNNTSTSFFAPSISLCTDNAAYIASCAFFNNHPVDWKKITAIPDLSVEINNLS